MQAKQKDPASSARGFLSSEDGNLCFWIATFAADHQPSSIAQIIAASRLPAVFARTWIRKGLNFKAHASFPCQFDPAG